MTEADYLLIANEYINTSFMLVSVLFSLVSAFLPSSHLVAKSLNKVVSGLLILLYSLAYYWIGSVTINSNIQISGFVTKMQGSEFDFTWSPIVSISGDIIIAAVLVPVTYLASLAFFVYSKFTIKNREMRPYNQIKKEKCFALYY
ncbi:MAG: hypothetical protein AB8B95_14765 [Pseudohongiellaceae bacterium]